MHKLLFMILCFFLLTGLLPGPAFSDVPFTPSWKVGDQWVVEARYPDPSGAEDMWSAPVFWVYHVEREERGSWGKGYVIEVRSLSDADGAPVLRLLYRAGDYRLLTVESIKILRGKEVSKIFHFEMTFPVDTRQSPVPYDAPVFPIQIPSSLDFSYPKEVFGGITNIETIRQEAKKVLPETVGLPWDYSGKELIEIRCQDLQGNELFFQYWDASLPWPVYGRNLNISYRLVQ